MKTDRNRLLFVIGTALLISAVLNVTLFPYLIINYMPAVIIPIEIIKSTVAYLYVVACVLYVFSVGFFDKQISVLMGVFSYYLLFQLFVFLSHKQFFG